MIGIDCEMVGVGRRGEDSILARISLVNHFGNCIYDKFVKPTEKVVDFRTLKYLAKRFLVMKVQEGEHNSVQDAQAAMDCTQSS